MDNVNKIKNTELTAELKAKDFIPAKQVHKEVRMFLDSELTSIYNQSKLQSYNLSKEYAETKSHHSPLPLVILAICLAVVLGTVVVMTSIISNKNRNITVEMNVFDDLNLKDLLDSVSKVQDSYDNAVKQRSIVISDRETAVRAADEKKEQDIFVVKSTKLSSKEEKQRLDAIENEYKLTLSNIETTYAPKIAALDTEIHEYEKQLQQYDSSKVEAAQEQERLLNSERRVQELERRKLEQQYEARIEELEQTIADLRKSGSENVYKSVSSISEKYQAEIDGLDPKIKDRIADNIVKDAKSINAPAFSSGSLKEEVTDTAITQGLEKYQSAYNDFTYLNKIIVGLPQKNTIPSYVKATKELVDSMGETFSEAAIGYQKDKNELTGAIVNLRTELSDLNKEHEDLIDDYNSLVDELEDKEKELVQKDNELALSAQQLDETKLQYESEITGLKNEFTEASKAQKNYFETCIEGIITSAKAMAAVISAEDKNNIRIFILPEVIPYITEAGIPAEIKAAKSIKGTLISDGEEYYKFVPAVDKNGEEISFDFSTVYSGLIVKLTLKK